jgi:hypothetical protein
MTDIPEIALLTGADVTEGGFKAALAQLVGHVGQATGGQGGQVAPPAGAAATPALSFDADRDTGLFRAGADQLGFATNGVQRALLSTTALQLDVPLTGTAVQSAPEDATAGRLMKTGAFGLGTATVPDAAAGALDQTRFVRALAASGGTPDAATDWHMLHVSRVSGGRAAQFAIADRTAASAPRAAIRHREPGGGWSPWNMLVGLRNLVGTVANSGGVPSGAVIERGANANGDYVRFADGTQLCWIAGVTFAFNSADLLTYTWTFPAGFAGAALPIVLGLFPSGADYTGLSRRDAGTFSHGGGTLGVVCVVNRTAGASRAFVSGDQIANMRLFASGRWFT